jgi:hypothetical protein
MTILRNIIINASGTLGKWVLRLRRPAREIASGAGRHAPNGRNFVTEFFFAYFINTGIFTRVLIHYAIAPATFRNLLTISMLFDIMISKVEEKLREGTA